MLAAGLAYKRPGWPTDPVYGDSTTQNHFSPGCWGTSWHTSVKLLIHSLWLVLENPPSEGSRLRDACKLCQHPALSRADLSPVCYEQRVTEVFQKQLIVLLPDPMRKPTWVSAKIPLFPVTEQILCMESTSIFLSVSLSTVLFLLSRTEKQRVSPNTTHPHRNRKLREWTVWAAQQGSP